MRSPVCFIDTETLGLEPDLHPVWEIAMIVGSEEFCWQLPVTDGDIANADPYALEITGFGSRYQGPDLQERRVILGGVATVTAGCHLAGAVVSFDEERLRREMLRTAGCPKPTWHYHLIDVENLAAGYLAGRRYGEPDLLFDGGDVSPEPPWDSEELSRAVGVEPDRFDRHTALGDARWARAVYEAVMGR